MDPFQPFCDTLNRRLFIKQASIGLGAVAMSSAFGSNLMAATSSYQIIPKARRVIFLFMAGAPSQLDLFDYKPGLEKWHGKLLPKEISKGQRVTTMTRGAPVSKNRPAMRWSGSPGSSRQPVRRSKTC